MLPKIYTANITLELIKEIENLFHRHHLEKKLTLWQFQSDEGEESKVIIARDNNGKLIGYNGIYFFTLIFISTNK